MGKRDPRFSHRTRYEYFSLVSRQPASTIIVERSSNKQLVMVPKWLPCNKKTRVRNQLRVLPFPPAVDIITHKAFHTLRTGDDRVDGADLRFLSICFIYPFKHDVVLSFSCGDTQEGCPQNVVHYNNSLLQ